MKRGIAICVMVFLSHILYAQTWDEWFKQKKTQIKYLTDQIAALQVYQGYVTQGYKIAKNGLSAISDTKEGEFHLHQAFFSSLSSVNPAIKNEYRIISIITLEEAIKDQCRACLKKLKIARQVNGDEKNYVRTIFTNLQDSCANNIADLTSILTVGQLQLSDDERLKRINAIYNSMKNKCVFARSFSNNLNNLLHNRQKEENETEELKALYNLK